ncbi:DUF1959 family protein [Methanobrevibacter sp. DSM 116169]|uniref:DUF1959 family protein n=1 Tax=Methanobrevibacter sp. DSM 116169 TaxID=3242727 RepID=UPI0038FCE845
MDKNEKLKMMKNRILDSYAWKRDVIVPLSEDFNVTTEEIENVLFKDMDMSSLSNTFATYETATVKCLLKRLHIDLNLCWIEDTLNLISKKDSDNLKLNLVNEINAGKEYNEVLKEGREKLFNFLKNL